MTPRILTVLMAAAALQAAPGNQPDGFLPAGSRLVPIATLPAPSEGGGSRSVVRLAPSGRPMMLYRGRIVALAEAPGGGLADWTPPADSDPVRDFCWLDDHLLVLVRASALDFLRDGKPVRGVVLPSRGLRLARADASHCYLFGGPRGSRNRDVLLVGEDGAIRNLFRAPDAVTAVAGDGARTFVAVGPVVYVAVPGTTPKPVFSEQSAITDLAYAPPTGVFYVTEDGAGCMESPGSGILFLRRPLASMDGRARRLLLLTKDREILLITPIAGFPRAIRDVQALARDEQ